MNAARGTRDGFAFEETRVEIEALATSPEQIPAHPAVFSRFFRTKCLVGGVGLVIVLSLAGCRERPAAEAVPADGVYLNHAADVSYVGREACRTCHADKYETYVRSQMGRSFRPATLDNSDAVFEGVEPVYDAVNDLYYEPFHRGQDLFVKEYRLDGRDTVYLRAERIDYIVGSGHHTNSHMMNVNGYLYQVPLTYYVQDGKWDLPPGFDGRKIRFDRPILQACMTCHNAMPEFIPGSENRFAEVPHGIDCERCHGPGSAHIDAIMSGRIVNTQTDIDYTIVNPRKLPVDRQLDVCARCHMQGPTVYRPGKTAADFRPGMRLADVFNVLWPRFTDSTSAFIMASHPDRLGMSACFQASHTEGSATAPMTCLTCHDPHLPIEALGPDHYRNACLTCHAADPATAQAPACTEEAPVRARVGDDCASCHMPTSGTTDIPHVRITDHYIRVPGPPTPVEPRQLVRIASLIDPKPSYRDRADGYLTYYEEFSNIPVMLDSAAAMLELARREMPEAELLPSLIRLWFWQQRYARIVEKAGALDPNTVKDGWTWYRVGESFYQMGRYRDALRYLSRAVEHEPQNLRFLNRLATVYSADGQIDAALARFDALLQANPKFEEGYNNRGFTRVAQGDLQGAEADFRAALALNPNIEQALANLTSLLYNTNRKDEARHYMQRLLRLRPDHPPYQQLARLLSE